MLRADGHAAMRLGRVSKDKRNAFCRHSMARDELQRGRSLADLILIPLQSLNVGADLKFLVQYEPT